MPAPHWWLLCFKFNLNLTSARNCSWCTCCWNIRTTVGWWHCCHAVFLQHSLLLSHLHMIWSRPILNGEVNPFPKVTLAIYSRHHQGMSGINLTTISSRSESSSNQSARLSPSFGTVWKDAFVLLDLVLLQKHHCWPGILVCISRTVQAFVV